MASRSNETATVTLASVDELVSRRLFELENKLRDHMMLLINPYSKKCREVMDQHDLLLSENHRVEMQLEKLES